MLIRHVALLVFGTLSLFGAVQKAVEFVVDFLIESLRRDDLCFVG